MKKRYKKECVTLIVTSFLIGCAADVKPTTSPEQNERVSLETFSSPSSPERKTPKPISLYDAANLVIAYHPKVAQAISSEKGEEEMINIAKAGYYPQVKGGMSFGYDHNSDKNDNDQVRSLDLEVQQTLYDFGKTSNSVKSAEYGYQSARAKTESTNEELIHSATAAVINSVRYQKLIKLTQQQVAQVSSLVNLIEDRQAQGASNLSDVLHVRSRLDEVQSEELDTRTQYQIQLQNLHYLTGVPTELGATIEELPEVFDQICATPINWEEIPEYIIADIEAKRALAEFELSKSEEKPTISLSGIASHDFNKNRAPSYNSRMDSRISLNVSVPIYQGGGLAAKKRAAENWARASEARKEEIRIDINRVISDSQVNLQNMQNRRDLLIRRVNNLKGTRELYKKQYLDLGTRSLVDLLNSEQEFHRAQVDVENNKLDIIQTKLSCAFYHGKLDEYFSPSQTSN